MSKTARLAVDTAFSLQVNGVKQYIEIKGVSRTNPVLLFIHGGPSWPATPMNRKYSQDLTKDFTFVSWDQRNCGKSQTDTTIALTPSLYVDDAHQVTQFLKQAFHKNKIFVVGHSWGSLIGVMLVQKYPQDYAAYIGIGQFVNPGRSTLLARKYVAEQAILKKDTATLNALAKIPFSEQQGYRTGLNGMFSFMMLSDKYLSTSEVPDLPNPAHLYSDYNFDWMAPVMRSTNAMLPYLNGSKTNLFQHTEFKLPVYIFAGKYDFNTSAEVAKQYFAVVKAPKKQLFLFEHSGHAPNWEKPALFRSRLLQITAANKTK